MPSWRGGTTLYSGLLKGEGGFDSLRAVGDCSLILTSLTEMANTCGDPCFSLSIFGSSSLIGD
jgi:hypothetical protein